MENVAGLALQQRFPHKSSYSFKNSDCRHFSFFNDGALAISVFSMHALFRFHF